MYLIMPGLDNETHLNTSTNTSTWLHHATWYYWSYAAATTTTILHNILTILQLLVIFMLLQSSPAPVLSFFMVCFTFQPSKRNFYIVDGHTLFGICCATVALERQQHPRVSTLLSPPHHLWRWYVVRLVWLSSCHSLQTTIVMGCKN